MGSYPERQTSKAAGWSRRVAAFSLVLLATVWLGHHFGLVETQGYLWVLGLVALLAALALLFAGFAFSRLWNFGDRGGRDLTVGALGALLVLAPYGFVAYQIATTPPLRDISTDLADPPALASAVDRSRDMNVLAPLTPGEQRLQAENYPLATGRSYDAPADEIVDAVETVAKRQGWPLTGPIPAADAQSEVIIDTVAKSFILDLPADVAIRVTDSGDATLVDMRSASRYGRYDLGDNAARIAGFLAELDQEVAGRVGTAAAE
ncbi:DUF1499 domain-containing protein [Mesorhizobium sp. A623]